MVSFLGVIKLTLQRERLQLVREHLFKRKILEKTLIEVFALAFQPPMKWKANKCLSTTACLLSNQKLRFCLVGQRWQSRVRMSLNRWRRISQDEAHKAQSQEIGEDSPTAEGHWRPMTRASSRQQSSVVQWSHTQQWRAAIRAPPAAKWEDAFTGNSGGKPAIEPPILICLI